MPWQMANWYWMSLLIFAFSSRHPNPDGWHQKEHSVTGCSPSPSSLLPSIPFPLPPSSSLILSSFPSLPLPLPLPHFHSLSLSLCCCFLYLSPARSQCGLPESWQRLPAHHILLVMHKKDVRFNLGTEAAWSLSRALYYGTKCSVLEIEWVKNIQDPDLHLMYQNYKTYQCFSSFKIMRWWCYTYSHPSGR